MLYRRTAIQAIPEEGKTGKLIALLIEEGSFEAHEPNSPPPIS
jgi:hypothetical protein